MIAVLATLIAATLGPTNDLASNLPAPATPVTAPVSAPGTNGVPGTAARPASAPLLSRGSLAGTNASASSNRASLFVLPPSTGEDPVEIEYRKVLALDDAAHEEIDAWIRAADASGSTTDDEALAKRIGERLGAVEIAYREFLERYTNHVNARVALGSFLGDTGREADAQAEWKTALELDPKNAAVYNNLAGIYGHRGPVTNAFVYYEKAIELAPREAVYHQNFATTVFLYRRDVMEHYHFDDEQKVFDFALSHYRKALELEPDNFLIATDLAQTYYLIKPPRYDDALAAWRRAFELASDDLEREGIRIHLARVQVQAGRFSEARTQLGLVTNVNYAVIRDRIQRTLERRERGGDDPTGDRDPKDSAVPGPVRALPVAPASPAAPPAKEEK